MEQFLKPAIRAEKKGVGIFYFDENKASKYTAYSNKIGNIPTGFVHNIAEAGLNVKSQTETLQFKRWFADSKVVDQNGEPLVVYHGSSAVFYAFDPKKIKSGAFGKGIYLSPSKANARAYGSNVMALYAKIAKPYIIRENLGSTAAHSRIMSVCNCFSCIPPSLGRLNQGFAVCGRFEGIFCVVALGEANPTQ